MSTTAPTLPPTPARKMVSTGVYFDSETLSRVEGWITPAFRSRGEVIKEAVRVLHDAGWKPGYDGIAFLEAKKEAAPVSTPQAASKLHIPRKRK